ncbi:unnamed protein product, partial [Choristocarpus tenellus]
MLLGVCLDLDGWVGGGASLSIRSNLQHMGTVVSGPPPPPPLTAPGNQSVAENASSGGNRGSSSSNVSGAWAAMLGPALADVTLPPDSATLAHEGDRAGGYNYLTVVYCPLGPVRTSGLGGIR